MPRYYFHLHNDVDAADYEGSDFDDLDAARVYAACVIRELAGSIVKEDGRFVPHHRIDIEDGDGSVLASVRFDDAVRVEE